MSDYITTIGLEVHAELHTNSKMWCGCKNDPYEKRPNQNVCEICMAHPGTLPVPNKEAIKKVITVGLAVQDSKDNIANFTEFDRKNYFYPDIPKGYQISQYKLPIVTGGKINGIELTRIHLEEDTAKSTHDHDGYTLVDYNRAGVPLMELVTEPVVHSAEEAVAFARELQRILRYVGASEANMELGQMRIEANISVSKDKNNFGTKVEVKNLNSFASVEGAIKYEVERHIDLIESGGKVVQETRGWDENKQETFSQRKKENAHDYRYFPDPDLPKLYLHELFDIKEIKRLLPELPKDIRKKYQETGLLQVGYIDILLDNIKISNYFQEVLKSISEAHSIRVANYLLSDALGLLAKDTSLSLPKIENFGKLILMSYEKLSSRGTKDILAVIMKNDQDPEEYAKKNNLIQTNDTEALKKIIIEVISENPKQVADYKSGKETMFMYFVGQCMKKSKGAGNPSLFQELLKDALK